MLGKDQQIDPFLLHRYTLPLLGIFDLYFRAKMLQTAQLRNVMEEEEIKGMLHKKQGGEKEFDQALEQNDELSTMNYHKLDFETLFQQFESDDKSGLSEAKAEEKLKRVGPNKLNEKKTLPWYIKLILEMTGIFSLLLWAGAILSFIAYGIQKSRETENVDSSNLLWILN